MSKICPLKTYDPESYESWLASFELGTDDDGNDVYEVFKHTQIHLNNAILSNGDKVVLLESIKEDLINMGYDSSSEPVTRLEDLIKSYGTMRSNSVPMRLVINTHFDNTIPESIKSIKNPLLTQSELALFIPIVATHINSHILTVLYAKLKEICLWDELSKTIISDDIELTANIEGYKLSLIKILQEFTGISKPVTIDDFLPQESADNYKEIMQQAWNRISTMLQNGIIDTQITPDSLSSVINPIMAFYVLLNFDKIIDQVLSDFIVVNPAYKNSLESESTKYKVKQRERKNQSWNDDANTSDGDNIYDHLLVTFITSTKDSTSGLYLTKEFATDFLVVIKDALENQDYTATVNKPQLTNLWNAVFGIQFSIQERIEFLILWLLLPVDNRDTSDHLADPLHDIVRKLGFGQLQALGKRLQKYLEAYKKKYQSATAVKQAEMDRTRNVGEKFISLFDKGVNGFVLITENGVSYIQSGHKFKAKQYVVDKMRTALTEILTKQLEFYFEPNLLLGTTSADAIIHLDSENIINFISIITGINLHDAEMRDRFTNAGFRMAYFIREYRKIARNVLSDNKFVHASVSDKVEEIIKRLKKNSHYIEFSDTIIADNIYHLERLFNQNGQEQAKTTIPTVSTSQTYAINKFKSGLGANTFNYLADRAPVRSQSLRTWDESENKAAQLQELGDFVQNISFAGDVAITGKAESVKWTELNELQIVEAWIKHLYLQSSVENGVTTFLPDAASDKVKVPFVSLNNMVQDSLTTLSINELQSNIYFKQHETYYKAVERLIVNKWQVLFPEASITSFESLAQFLNNNVITAENVADRLRTVQLTNPNFTFQHLVDYVIKKEENPNDKYNLIQRITVNSSLHHEIQKAHSQTKFDAWTERCFKIFLENFSQYGLNNFLPEKWDLSKLDLGQRQRLAALFDLPIGQFDTKIDLLTKALKGEGVDLSTLSQDLIKNILDGKTSGNEVVDLRVKFLYKWYLSFNTTREAFLLLYQKHYWLHKDNKSDLFEEMSGRITTGKKRNNAESATFCRLQQGLKRGVPKQIRTCTISSINTNVVNHFGDRDTLNSHDGAIYTSYILRILEKNSSTTVEMSDVAKIIGLSQSGAGFEQIKCADYAITNVWIQNTIKQNEVLDPYSEQYFDGHLLMKKMLEVAAITDTFKTNLRDHKVNIGLPNVIVNIGGRRAVMSAFLVNNDNQIVCQYTYLDDSSYVKPDDLAAALNVTHLGNNAFDIKNLYDLWCLFGAEYSEAQKEDGTFATSNGSQEWMAYLMSEYDPSLKSQMIGKIIDVQSSKSTQQFVNSKKDVWDPTKSLITGVLDTYDYGVQQDSSHLTDEDDISSLTQVITAIAINGQNAELAEELYELLGQITADLIAELLDVQKTSNKTEFYVQLGKSIAKSLSRNTVVSNASRLITESLQNIIKSNKTFAESAIPISNQLLYWFVTSELLSKLNRIIRQRFPGMAVVQNPAQGIIGLLEGHNGQKYTKTDIKDAALEWWAKLRREGKVVGIKPISTIIQEYLLREPEPVTKDNIEQLTIGKRVKQFVFDPITNMLLPVVTEIKDDKILSDISQKVLNGELVEIVNEFVDEKITKENAGKLNIGYKVRAWFTREEIINGVKQEIREYRIGEISDPFVLRDIYNQVLNDAECYIVHSAPRNLATRNTSWQEVAADGSITGNNLWLLASTQAILKSNPSDLEKNWHRANMVALQTKNGYYPTLETYKKGELRTVINILDKSGEEVLPKQYEKKLGLKHSLSYIKNKGYEYFSELIENRINLTKDIVVGTYNARNKHTAFAVSTNSFDIVFTDNTEINIENNTFLESIGNGQYLLYTADGQEIVGAILPTDKCEVEYIPSETGKDIIKVKFEEKDAKGTIRLENPRFVEHVLNLLPVNGVYIGNGYGNSNIWRKDAALIKYLNDTAMASDKKNIEIEAKKTYSSFLLSLRTISARIPSQSFQSFLSNETVAFTEDLLNNGYMNIWEMWFQGSDYDIDKAYTLIFGLDGSGQIPGHALMDYTSPDTLFKSLILQNPDKNLEIYTGGGTVGETEHKFVDFEQMLTAVGITKDVLLEIAGATKELLNSGNVNIDIQISKISIDQISQILEGLKYYWIRKKRNAAVNSTSIYAPIVKAIAEKFNEYNKSNFTVDQAKNKVIAVIRYASSDLRNLQASEVPMISKAVNDCIKNSQKNVDIPINVDKQYVNEDPTHIANFLYQAAIGKKGVGVSANSIKAVGSILQRANMNHRQQELGLIPIQPDIKLDLNIPVKYKNQAFHNVEAQLRHCPNSVISKDLFRAYYLSEVASNPFYNLYNNIIANRPITTTSPKELKFIRCFNTVKAMLGDGNFDFIDVLYEMHNQEENVADILSVFISLCTDNAKELSLYKIGAIPEMLNIPLALVSLGVDIQDVTDICIQYLVPLISELSHSLTDGGDNFDAVVKLMKAKADSETLDMNLRQGYTELYQKIIPIAQLMRTIASYFKINQGSSVKYDDALDFINKLDKELAKLKITNPNGIALTFADFFALNPQDENNVQKIRESAIEQYDRKNGLPLGFKGFNILDVILNSKHFYQQLKGLIAVVDGIRDNICVSNITRKLQKSIVDKKFSTRRLTQVVNTTLFCNALRTMPDISFEVGATTEKFGQWNLDLGAQALIGVSNYNQANNLILFVELGVIPFIKKQWGHNFFVLNFNLNSRQGHYTLPYNSYETKGDLRTKTDINKASVTFEEIAGFETGLTTINGTPITIGDLLYMYITLVNGGRINTAVTIMYPGMIRYSKLSFESRINQYYTNIDRLTGIASSDLVVVSPNEQNDNKSELAIAIAELENLQEQVAKYAKTVKNKGLYSDPISGLSYNIDVKIPYYALNNGTITTETEYGTDQEELNTLISSILKEQHTGSTLEGNAVLNNGIIMFTVKVPLRIGQGKDIVKLVTIGPIDLIHKNGLYLITKAGLQDLHNGIVNNIASLKSQLAQTLKNQSGVYMENTALNDVQIISIDGKQITPADILSEFKDVEQDVIFQIIQELLQNNHRTILKINGGDYVRSHVEKIGNDQVIVINQNDFAKGVTKEQKLYTLLNLLVDSEISGLPTQSKRLGHIIRKWLQIKGPSGTLTQMLKLREVHETMKKSVLLKQYYHALLEDATSLELKQIARSNLVSCQRALLYRDVYYYDLLDSDKSPAQIGDIYVEETPVGNIEYVFLGKTKDNICIFAPITNGVVEIKLTYEMSTSKSFKRILRKKLHFNNSSLLDVSNVNLLDPEPYEEDMFSFENGTVVIMKKEKGETEGKRLTIVDVLYKRTADGFEKDFLYKDFDGNLAILDKSKIDMVQELDKVAINLTDMKNLTTIKLKNNGVRLMSSEFLLNLVNKAGVGYYIMINNKPEIVLKIDNELIETVSGAVIPLSDVEEIKISSSFLDKIDPYLVNVIFKNNLYFNPSDSNADISLIPIFKDGYMSFLTSSESDKKYVHPYIEINGVKYKKFILDHNTTRVKFDTTNIEIGDIIIDKDPYTYYHVLDVNEVSDGKSTKTYITVLKVDGIDIDTHTNKLSPVIETINVDNLNIQSELWKTNTNINKSSIISKTNLVVFNPTDKLYEFLDTIAKKFGTQIQIIADTTPEGMKWFAKVDNGTVLINMALKPTDQSAEDYILEKSLHEFAHLFLTVFRIQHPDQYVQMVKALPSSLNMGSFYTTTAANLDEFLVDVLMEMIKTDTTNNPDSQEVLKIFNTALERIVNLKLPEFTPADWQASVFKLLKGIKINTEQDMDLMSLREQAISDEFIDNVKLEC